jgi:hypothetical protein
VDDEYLADLKDELIYAKKLAIDEDDRVLAWIGETESASQPTSVSVSAPAADHKPSPISYTPPYLTEKILTSCSALEGERKQVTVLFADIKDSTELIKDLDPEDAQKLLDPAIHIMMGAVHRFEGTVKRPTCLLLHPGNGTLRSFNWVQSAAYVNATRALKPEHLCPCGTELDDLPTDLLKYFRRVSIAGRLWGALLRLANHFCWRAGRRQVLTQNAFQISAVPRYRASREVV